MIWPNTTSVRRICSEVKYKQSVNDVQTDGHQEPIQQLTKSREKRRNNIRQSNEGLII